MSTSSPTSSHDPDLRTLDPRPTSPSHTIPTHHEETTEESSSQQPFATITLSSSAATTTTTTSAQSTPDVSSQKSNKKRFASPEQHSGTVGTHQTSGRSSSKRAKYFVLLEVNTDHYNAMKKNPYGHRLTSTTEEITAKGGRMDIHILKCQSSPDTSTSPTSVLDQHTKNHPATHVSTM